MAASKSVFFLGNYVYFSTENCNVRKIDVTTGIVTHLAGTGCTASGQNDDGDKYVASGNFSLTGIS